jgi:hypothetical protein
MSRPVAPANAARFRPSPGQTPGAARSIGSDGSDGDRNTASGVALRRAALLALLALPGAAGGEPADIGLVAAVRSVELHAGRVAAAAAALEQTAAGVAADGRVHSLQRLADRQWELERALQGLQRALAAVPEAR